MKVRGGASLVLLLATSVVWLTAAALSTPPRLKQAPPAGKVNFSRDVLPILSDKCFKCHGPDAESRQAEMRLDTAQGAFMDRGGRWPLVPGKPGDSMVIKRITSADSPMPPRSSGKSLSKQEIELLTRWVSEGAHYNRLWSFEPLPATVAVPKVASHWPRNDIDRFILERLQRERLTPSPPATRERWLRRVTLDLTGLPPTEEEITSFVADASPTAFDKVVDRLLASPHFGERAAVDWLDAARYSDSYGYQSDLISPSWPYRDWVVKAFNENMPYDQFLVDNLAGDLLKNPTRDQRLATAFNRLHRQSNEGGSIAAEYLCEYSVDRVSTFGTAVLGLTLGCARCHDHKFDPVTQKEFYQLYAYFNSINEYGLLLSTEIVPTPSLLLPTPEQEAQLKELEAQDEVAREKLAGAVSNTNRRFEQWIAGRPDLQEVHGLIARFPFSTPGAEFSNNLSGIATAVKLGKVDLVPGRSGNAVRFDGDNGLEMKGLPGKERWDSFTWTFWMKDSRLATTPMVLLQRTGGTDVGFCGFDLMLENGYITARVMRAWPGNALAIRTKAPVPANEWTHVAWSYDGGGRAAGLKLYVNGRQAEITVLNDKLWKKINAYGDLGESRGDWAFALRFRDAGFKGLIADVTMADRALSGLEVAQLHDGTALASALKTPSEHSAELEEYFATALDPEVKAAQASVQATQTALANFEAGIYEIEVMEETREPVPAYLLARGRYDAPKTNANRVVRGVPRALPPLLSQGRNDRLTLAKWVTKPDHPLTARVAVNRLWQMVFGVGLVETSENFGVQGTPPTHPELLDYLARKFVDSGWNVKAMVKMLVLSSTYRQDSALTAKLAAADPLNHLYARGPSIRMSAEMIRDTALAASGLLNAKVGGPPVNPYQPAGLWTEFNGMSPQFVQSKGSDLYRRSIYSTWKRTTPVPSMLMFDATSREACSTRRPATNTPLQALVLLNDVQFVESARALADHVLQEPGGDAVRIRSVFLRLAGREPDRREMAILQQTLREQRIGFKADPKSAAKLVAVGESKASPADAIELAAMTVVAQTVMNSDAVVWKR